MLTLRRFATLAESYGADLARWPEETRAEAKRLAASSVDAQRILADARVLDWTFDEASKAEDRALWHGTEAEAALTRLRGHVATAIAAPEAPARRPAVGGRLVAGFGGVSLGRLEWFGVATGGSLAVAGGLVLGYLTVSAGSAETVMTLLQPGPLHLFGFS
jgi:hypothetical protein